MPLPNKQPRVMPAAEPNLSKVFDPWNSSSTGHQRAENRLSGSLGWRDTRNMKLREQFSGGASGGKRLSDLVGAGSKDWDEKHKALISDEVRFRAKTSVMDMLKKPGTMKQTSGSTARPSINDEFLVAEEKPLAQQKEHDDQRNTECNEPRRIFEGLVIYLNGSTHPVISDHKLKHLLAENGARMSIHLGRRQVTHVILGRPAGGSNGAGGGLAGGKLQKEIQKVRGCGVKFVGVEWVLESIQAGKRLPEARFSNLKIASKGQQSVYGMYSRSAIADSATSDPPSSGQR